MAAFAAALTSLAPAVGLAYSSGGFLGGVTSRQKCAFYAAHCFAAFRWTAKLDALA